MLNVICLSLDSCVKIMHVCDLTCINLKIICDFPFLPFSLLSDEPLPGRNNLSIIGRNAASSFDSFSTNAISLLPILIFIDLFRNIIKEKLYC